jgi:hypothetical protein
MLSHYIDSKSTGSLWGPEYIAIPEARSWFAELIAAREFLQADPLIRDLRSPNNPIRIRPKRIQVSQAVGVTCTSRRSIS